MKPLALVAENDPGTRKLLHALLTRIGFDVDLVATGADALILLENVRYDAVILDLNVPQPDGIAILEHLIEAMPDVLCRVIILSAVPDARLAVLAERFPSVPVLRKPFELDAVIEAATRVSADREPHVPSGPQHFCRSSMRAGAKAGVIVASRGGVVEPVSWFGYAPGDIESYFPMPLESPYPLCVSIRHGTPLWIASMVLTTTDYPMLRPVWEKHQSRALASVPLLDGGRVIGAVGWTFREPRLFHEPEREIFTSIAASVLEWVARADSRAESAQL